MFVTLIDTMILSSRLLGLMWHSMASGPPIDEQRILRWEGNVPYVNHRQVVGPSASASVPSEPAAPSSDEEVDPNDIVQPAQASVRQDGTMTIAPVGYDEDSDDDW